MYSSRGQWFFLNSKPSIGRLNCLVYNHTPITVISDPATLPFMLHYHIRIGFNHTKCMHEWMRPSSSQISQQKVSMVRFTGVISNRPNRLLHWKRKRFQRAVYQSRVWELNFNLELIFYFGSPLKQTRDWHTLCCVFKEEIEHEITQPWSIYQSHQELDVHLLLHDAEGNC